MSKPKFIYTDCTGSGTPDYSIERSIVKNILPYYANTHSDSYGSQLMNKRINDTRTFIKRICCHPLEGDYVVLFTGNGATQATRHLAHVLDDSIDVVVYSILEHHSNSLMWKSLFPRATNDVVDVLDGSIDAEHFRTTLEKYTTQRCLVAITACSNVFGTKQNIAMLSSIAHSVLPHCVLVVDYATLAPYDDIHVAAYNIDAVCFSMHKFKGGQSTPGILIARKSLFRHRTPFLPGGGTVDYCDKKCVLFTEDIEHREEGGTPNIVGIIKSGMIFEKKERHLQFIKERTIDLVRACDNFFTTETFPDSFRLLTPLQHPHRLPIYIFTMDNVHPNKIVKKLSDDLGIQARSGIACCSLLAEKLFDTNNVKEYIVQNKYAPNTYGFVRLSFNYEYSVSKALRVLRSIVKILFFI